MVAVLRWVHGDDLVAERQLVAVLLDQLAHIVAILEGHRKARERPRHRVARGERLGIGVHGARLVVSGDHVDTLLGLALHGALPAQPVEVGVGVGDELVAAEEVNGGVVGDGVAHAVPLSCRFSVTNVAARR